MLFIAKPSSFPEMVLQATVTKAMEEITVLYMGRHSISGNLVRG